MSAGRVIVRVHEHEYDLCLAGARRDTEIPVDGPEQRRHVPVFVRSKVSQHRQTLGMNRCKGISSSTSLLLIE